MRVRKSQAKRRAEILDTARALFIQNGYGTVRIRDIMHETGLSRGGFYHHFGSKADYLRFLELALEEYIGPMLVRAIRKGIADNRLTRVEPEYMAGMFLALNARANRKILTGAWAKDKAVGFSRSALAVFAEALGTRDLFSGLLPD